MKNRVMLFEEFLDFLNEGLTKEDILSYVNDTSTNGWLGFRKKLPKLKVAELEETINACVDLYNENSGNKQTIAIIQNSAIDVLKMIIIKSMKELKIEDVNDNGVNLNNPTEKGILYSKFDLKDNKFNYVYTNHIKINKVNASKSNVTVVSGSYNRIQPGGPVDGRLTPIKNISGVVNTLDLEYFFDKTEEGKQFLIDYPYLKA
jgi:hypothetical protein